MIITALTCACADVFENGNVYPGGEALNYACAAKNADPEAQVCLIGAAGDDEYEKLIRRTAAEHGVDMSHFYTLSGSTARNITYLTEDGDRYYKPDSWDGGVYNGFIPSEEDDKLILGSDVVHTTVTCPAFAHAAALKKRGKFRFSVDFDNTRNFSDFEEYFAGIDFAFMSGDEAVCRKAQELSEKYGGIFTVTLAAEGSRSYFRGREHICAAENFGEVVDTTGCGDNFQAGFAVDFMLNRDISSALRAGSRCAAKVLGIYGGIPQKGV